MIASMPNIFVLLKTAAKRNRGYNADIGANDDEKPEFTTFLTFEDPLIHQKKH